MKSTLLIAIGCCFLTACHVKTEKKSSSYNDKYQYTVNGCNTGEHAFNSSSPEDLNRQICEALKSDSANNYCASSIRYETFKIKCPGYNWN